MKCLELTTVISCFIWPILILSVGAKMLLTLGPVTDKTAFLQKDFKYDWSNDPVYFGHITDLHISPYGHKPCQNLRDAFKVLNYLDPATTFITGDIVNTYSRHGRHCSTVLNISHFLEYKRIRDENVKNLSKLYEIVGNHDTWGVLSYDTYIAKDIFDKSAYSYSASRVVDNIRIVSYNPMVPPLTTGDLMNYWLTPHTITLDALERELEKKTDANVTIVIAHQPTEMYLPPLTSSISNRTLLELLEDPKYNIIAFINGHTHPRTPQSLKHKNFIEFTLTSLKKIRRIGVATVDNSIFNYVTLPIDNPFDHYAVLTFPVYDKEAVKTYPNEGMQIRLISFADTEKNYFVRTEDNEISGKMVRTRKLKEHVYLYTFDVQNKLSAGHHKLIITGDYNISMNFHVGVDLAGTTHIKRKPFNIEFFTYIIIAESILILISTIPAYFPDQIFGFIDRLNEWLSTGENGRFFFHPLCIALGPVCVGRRLKSQLTLTSLFLINLLATFVVPVMYYRVGGVPSKVYIYGYQIGDVYKEDITAKYYACLSLIFLIYPFILMASMFCFKFSLRYILSLVGAAGMILYAYRCYWKFGYNVDNYNWLKSPSFVYFPVFLCVLSVISFIITKRSNNHVINDKKND